MPAALVDTSILLYAISTAPEEAEKKAVAREILAGTDWGVSIQVLQEFYVNVTRAPAPAMDHMAAVKAVEQLLLRPVVVNDAALLRAALTLKERYGLSYWDAAVVAAAKLSGAAILYSEDMNDGQDYGGVRVVNPFRQG
ncbi:MAG: PIN domain-containing protein [Betaproteobacteria bacterium]|nr:PIN domain-containing protein [Betaproteobacteria bacterium]